MQQFIHLINITIIHSHMHVYHDNEFHDYSGLHGFSNVSECFSKQTIIISGIVAFIIKL